MNNRQIFKGFLLFFLVIGLFLLGGTLMSRMMMGECLQEAKGIVRDRTSGKPIPGVLFAKTQPHQVKVEYNQMNDSTGNWEFRAVSGGYWGCPDLNLRFHARGYKEIELNIPTGSKRDSVWTVWMVPEK